MAKHYHVIAGLAGGYLPNTNDVFTTKRDATRYALDLIERYRDDGERVVGNARTGYWAARESAAVPGAFWDYVEVSLPCSDACESEEDY